MDVCKQSETVKSMVGTTNKKLIHVKMTYWEQEGLENCGQNLIQR